MSHVNYFYPYVRDKVGHENDLTRAFLVLLRQVPMAQVLLFDLIRSYQQQHAFPKDMLLPPLTELNAAPPAVETQTSDLSRCRGRLLSILIADVASPPHRVGPSNRRAVYDGVVCYDCYGSDSGWVLIIENKKDVGHVWPEQLSPNIGDNKQIVCRQSDLAVHLAWHSIIQGITSLCRRRLISGAEKKLADDFLDFVAQAYPSLNPYSTFSICDGKEEPLKRRCIAILEEIAPGRIESHRGWYQSLRLASGALSEVVLFPERETGRHYWEIVLQLHPGDTISQARELYRNVSIDELLAVREKGWKLETNLHFSFMRSGLLWPSGGRVSTQQYLEYWKQHQDEIRQERRGKADYSTLLSRLSDVGMIGDDDVRDFRREFTDTKRNTVNVCPGVTLRFSWKLLEAEILDDRGEFVAQVSGRITEALSLWDQELEG